VNDAFKTSKPPSDDGSQNPQAIMTTNPGSQVTQTTPKVKKRVQKILSLMKTCPLTIDIHLEDRERNLEFQDEHLQEQHWDDKHE
jgi:hypothetical protein